MFNVRLIITPSYFKRRGVDLNEDGSFANRWNFNRGFQVFSGWMLVYSCGKIHLLRGRSSFLVGFLLIISLLVEKYDTNGEIKYFVRLILES